MWATFFFIGIYYIIPAHSATWHSMKQEHLSLFRIISYYTSVVNNRPAIEAAFSKARRVTFVGSITPAAEHVFILVISGIVTKVIFAFSDFLNNYRTFTDRRFQR